MELGKIDRRVGRPGEGNSGEGFRNHEAVPGVEVPGVARLGVEGAKPLRIGDEGELNGTGFGDASRAFGTIGGEGADAVGDVGLGHSAECSRTPASAGATNRNEAETLNGTGDEFAIEGLRDQNGDAEIAEAMCAGEQRTVPEGEDRRAGDGVSSGCSWRVDVAVTKRGAEQADERRRKRWDDAEEDALLAGKGHVLSVAGAVG